MLKKRIIYSVSTAIFLAVETLLGYILQTGSGRTINTAQYISVILAFLFCFLFFEKSFDYLFTQLALFITVIADYFLVWLSPQIKLWGMFFFFFAQLSYAARIYFSEKNAKKRLGQIISRVFLTVAIVIITLIVLKDGADMLSIVSMMYYANLALNLFWSVFDIKKHYILAAAFLFFVGCDTLIGISVLKQYFTIPPDSFIYKILYPGFDLAWAFYLPSQMLLAISLLPNRLKSKKD